VGDLEYDDHAAAILQALAGLRCVKRGKGLPEAALNLVKNV